MEIGSFPVVVFLFPVRYFIYNLCITCVHNTTVNVNPLSLPNFEKLAPHFKRKRSIILFLLRLRCLFSHFFIFLLISGYPLPHPPGQIGPICGRFGCHVWSIFRSLKVRNPRSLKNRIGRTPKGITILSLLNIAALAKTPTHEQTRKSIPYKPNNK